jgi:L-iditol 2-dehydrogenase
VSNLAAVMPRLGTIELRDVGEPALGARDAVVEIRSVGVCGSDISYYRVGRIGEWIVDGPLILGHEASGVVTAVGPEVSQVAIGDRVAIEPGTPCRDCDDCLRGRYHLCARLKFLATPPYDGALVQRLAIDERNLFHLPDSLSFDDGAMLEPLSVGIWACRRAGLEPGDRVLVTGAGPVGTFAAQAARAFGAGSVTLTDVSPFRLDVARSLGFEAEAADSPSPGAFDVLLECSGAPGALATGLARLGNHGRAAMVGIPKQSVELPLSSLHARELSIALVNRYAHTWPTAIDLAASGRVDVRTIVTHHFDLASTEQALTLSATQPDSMKAIIHPQD